VIDATGVGKPIVDMLKRAYSGSLHAVSITSGETVSEPGPYSHNVPKTDLVAAVEVVMQTHRLKALATCPLQEDLAAELSHFKFDLGARGKVSYEAMSGAHDDLVLALSLALWWAERRNGSVEGWLTFKKRQLIADSLTGPGGPGENDPRRPIYADGRFGF
jgi:hypothetical protein